MLDKGYGIMPNQVLFDESLSSTAKLIFVYISSLCAAEGYCWASNEHIGKRLGISKFQVSRHISALNKYLVLSHVTNEKRQIRLAENIKAPRQKAQGSLAEKRKHNITSEYYKYNKVSNNLGQRYKTVTELGLPDLSA